jgi:RHS repeat-associated protein
LSVLLPDGKVIEYVHDPLGRRIAKKVNGTITEKYLWQGMTRLLAVYDSSDSLLMRFEYADNRMPVALNKGGSTYYLTYDQVGSLRVVADASGNVVKRIDYDSFGNILDDTDPTFEVPFGFAGGLHDQDTGLVRFGYRDYDPDTGRWTAKDPIFFAGGDTDLYGYCVSDPINLIDPEGTIFQYIKVFSYGYAVGSVAHTVNKWGPAYMELDRQEVYLRDQLADSTTLAEEAILKPALERVVLQKAAIGIQIGKNFMEAIYSIVSPSRSMASTEYSNMVQSTPCGE